MRERPLSCVTVVPSRPHASQVHGMQHCMLRCSSGAFTQMWSCCALPQAPGGGVWGGGGFVGMHAGRFKSAFIASGVAGGDVSEKPTIVAARVAPAQPALPPPPPLVVAAAGGYSGAPAAARPSPASSASAQAVRGPSSCSVHALKITSAVELPAQICSVLGAAFDTPSPGLVNTGVLGAPAASATWNF